MSDIKKEEIEAIKKQMIANLKENVENLLLDNFVENFEGWSQKLSSVNSVISHVSPSTSVYTYDEFCKKVIEVTKKSLEESIDYETLFLTSEEYFKIIKESGGDDVKSDEAMLELLNKKFVENLITVLTKIHLKESIKYKLQERFTPYIETLLSKSVEVAESILKQSENKNSE